MKEESSRMDKDRKRESTFHLLDDIIFILKMLNINKKMPIISEPLKIKKLQLVVSLVAF